MEVISRDKLRLSIRLEIMKAILVIFIVQTVTH